VPYIVHTNFVNVGVDVVKSSKVIPVYSLPKDVQDIAEFGDECTIILLQEIESETKRVIIIAEGPSYSFQEGDTIRIVDVVEEWYVDWHLYNFFDESFSSLVIGEIEPIGCLCSGLPIICDLFCPLESNIKNVLYTSFSGKILLLFSKVVFFLAPVLLISVGLQFKRRFYLWSVPAILTLYSLQVFLSNFFSSLYNAEIPNFYLYFGYSFFVLIPFTLFLYRFEESEEGQKKIKEFYDKTAKLIDRLFR
jgi:hypothetical protein